MNSGSKPILLALDSNVFLAVLLPDETKASPENVRGAERVLRALAPGAVHAVTTAMSLAEMRWAFARSGRGDYMQAYHTLVTGLQDCLEVVPVSAALAFECGALRARYYARTNDLSYVDALHLATALEWGADVLISTDPHLLGNTDVPVMQPKDFPATGDVGALRRLPG